ncbi:L,D-transpeptidase family protein [Sphingomonas sp. ASV193]|uniref:L,D-transpeptidase family protein n=1 Tax=Sphingomonas sp. ASV193 TaxID=3144405 RepID=UPI0032E8B8EE
MSLRRALIPALLIAAGSAAALAQKPASSAPAGKAATAPPAAAVKNAGWAAPGTKGSPIDGTIFHAQVLLDAAGFPSGVIDGKKGKVFEQAIKGYQEANSLETNGQLDGNTRRSLLAQNRPSTIMVKLTPEQVGGPFVYPFPKKPEDQAKLPFMGYRNMLEEVAEEFHTTPDTIVALNGPDALIGPGQVLRLPNVVPAKADYGEVKGDVLPWFQKLNVDSGDIQGDYVVVSKHLGVLRVMKGTPPAGPLTKDGGKGAKYVAPTDLGQGTVVAQFPVTMGSTHDPLPLGLWKVVTYAYLPPFHYQPDLFWDAKDKSAPDQMLKPGPNGPVGLAWLDLTKEHYGIHGTSSPDTIGRAESHGCIRLSNWDVLRLSRMLKPGFKAVFTN